MSSALISTSRVSTSDSGIVGGFGIHTVLVRYPLIAWHWGILRLYQHRDTSKMFPVRAFIKRLSADIVRSSSFFGQAVYKNKKELQPRTKQLVIAILPAAGIDAADWKNSTDPRYCYNWAFGGKDEPSLFCIWHGDIEEEKGGRIIYRDHSHITALEVALEDGNNGNRTRRARHFHQLLQRKARAGQGVRVALVDGYRTGVDGRFIGKKASNVHFRALDEETWYPHYLSEESLEVVLVRGEPKLSAIVDEAIDLSLPITERIGNESDEGVRYGEKAAYEMLLEAIRSPKISAAVKERAEGKCELCRARGFATASNGSYLEAHHVFDFSSGGPDQKWAVIALCPNDHREAHYGKNREDLRERFVDILKEKYPENSADLARLLASYRDGGPIQTE